ncbi:hypothetical protein BDZ45DRAFT_750252 [Acephala macrosclerotiorum]|nr:hypothetical protein BDZ45DRAFT_750252 [Acephala macrosclerotiorum]
MSPPANHEQGMGPEDPARNGYYASGAQVDGEPGMGPEDPMRNDYAYGYSGAEMQRTESLAMDPVMFEKLFLNPQTNVHGDLRRMFAVPTPLALVGFGIALTPLACCLMGWRGSNNQKMGVADIGAYFWFGGLAVMLAAFGEWLLGNTFAFTVFSGYGAWYLSYAATVQPFYNAQGAYAYVPQPTLAASAAQGQLTPGYTSSFGFILVFMTVFSFIVMVCSIRVNVPFFLLLLAVTLAFALLSAALFLEHQAITLITEAGGLEGMGNNAAAVTTLVRGEARLKLTLRLVVGAGASFFAASMLNWFLLLAIMLAVVDFPLGLPVLDLSQITKSRSQIRKENKAREVTELKMR